MPFSGSAALHSAGIRNDSCASTARCGTENKMAPTSNTWSALGVQAGGFGVED